MSNIFCILAHYNCNNRINKNVISIIKNLHQLGIKSVIVSNSPVNDLTVLNELKNYHCELKTRENKGLDFGAWKSGLENDQIPKNTDYLLLLNDSVFLTLIGLEEILRKMLKENDVALHGLTDCYINQWHLQSYFLLFNKKIISTNDLYNFFKKDFNSFTKEEIIIHGEINLTQYFAKKNYKIKALFPVKNFIEDATLLKLNPTFHFAIELIENYNFPFIKKELIFKNSENIENSGKVLDYAIKNKIVDVNEVIESFTNLIIYENRKSSAHISVIIHLYYLNNIIPFLYKLLFLKNYNCQYYFNLSNSIASNQFLINLIQTSFKPEIILNSSNLGKDIGGKLALINHITKFKRKADLYLFLHDKQSLHSTLGGIWKEKLLKIIEPKNIEIILNKFLEDKKLGLIGAKEFISNEYNDELNSFNSKNREILETLLKKYKFNLKNYDFIGGTIFWAKAEIIYEFFKEHNPMEIRASLELGNVLDHFHGTNTHAWERMFSWIILNKNFKISGI